MINQDQYFYLNNGQVIKDLNELIVVLKIMDESTFYHHVTHDKNDFFNWIKYIFKDEALANKILKSNNKDKMALTIEKKLKSLENKKNKKETKKSLISQIKGAY